MTAPTEDLVVADLIDAIDPALPELMHLDAIERAYRTDPEYATAWLATMLRQTVQSLALAAGLPVEDLLRPMRQRVGGASPVTARR